MSRWLLSLVALGGLAIPVFAQKSPEETVKSMTVADGLQVEVFAAEPMLINPTSIDVDHLGRVWVCEAVNYRRKGFNRPILREEGDRIVILTDKDGDGKADDSSVFYQGKDLYGPLGICVAATPNGKSFSYKVFVCQSPDILLFEDKDGDGKADGPPKKFLTNFGGFDHDHGVHGINIGPDGKLYFTVGDSGVNGLQSADGKGRKYYKGEKDCQAGTVWRCDFDGNNLELIAHNFRNNYECCVNSFGEIWLSDNDDDGNQQTRICHVMPGGNYGYYPRGPGQTHWHEEQPGIVHKTMRTGFGSPTGICFYEGTLLPKRFHGQLLHTDAGPRELRAFHIKPKGAGYELEKENIVTSTDNWYRLSDVCVAPDGSVMLADWYDPGVGGHGMGDWKMGRIYRVTPKGHKGYKVPEMKLDSSDGVLTALDSSCLATRYIAIHHLATVAAKDAFPVVMAGVGQAAKPTLQARAHLQAKPLASRTPKGEHLSAWAGEYGKFIASRSQDGNFLALFVRSAGGGKPRLHKAEQGIDPFALAALREMLLGLRDKPAEEASPVILDLAKHYDGQDIFYRAALNIACGTDPKRREAILADFDKHFPEWNDKVADLVWELRPASVLPRLGKLLEDAKLTAAQKGRIFDILANSDDAASAGEIVLQLAAKRDTPIVLRRAAWDALAKYLPNKWATLKKSKQLDAFINKGLENLEDPEERGWAVLFIGLAEQTKHYPLIRKYAANASESITARVSAILVLSNLKTKEDVEVLAGIIDDEQARHFHSPAVEALAKMQTPDSLAVLQKLLLAKRSRFVSNETLLSALAGTRAGTGWLLQLKEQGKMPAEMFADAGRLLRNSPFQGERNKAMLLFPAPGKLDPKKLPPISELVKRTGNAARGEAILKASIKSEAQCLRCHTVRGVGGNIGPDQSMIGKKASRENLLESILLPSKAIADQQLQWKITTLDEKTVTGLLVEETPTSITLRDANGKDHTFATKDLEGPKQKSLVSIMPDNLVAALTEDELIDLVEYLLTLKTASITPETWHILGPFENIEDSALDKDLGLEKLKAIDLTATVKGRDGIMRWGMVRTTGTGYLDLAAYYAKKGANTATYLYRVIDSPVDQDGTLLIGNDDGAKIWINGEKVFENRDNLAATPEKHRAPVKLKKGSNTVLIKIVNGKDPHGLYFALTSGEELKLGK